MKQMNYKKSFLTVVLMLCSVIFLNASCKKGADNEHDHPAGYYTCSMHPQVIQKEPGNCPICGMKLVFVENKDADGKTGKESSKEAPADMYVCPMHPEITRDKPGKCPVCGMDLVKMDHSAHEHDSEAGGQGSGKNSVNDSTMKFSVTGKVLSNANLLTVPVKKEKFLVRADFSGHIDFNEDPGKMAIISTKYEGWVEEIFVSKEGVNVAAGQALFGIYSPTILTAKEEYVTTYLSLKGLYVSQGKSLDEMKADPTLSAARKKLRYLDVPESQIVKLETDEKAPRLTYFYSPIGGTVIKKDVLKGAFISAGQEVMRISNLATLWAYIHVFEKDLGIIRKGQAAVLKTTAYPDREFRGTVDLIYPYLDPDTKDIKVRISLVNPGGMLKPGMFAGVTINEAIPGDSLVIPDTAVIHSGDKSYVFVSLGAGDFEMRPVQIKVTSDGKSVITKGLAHNELVVVNGQFLLDSEASLKDAVSRERAATHVH